MADMPEVLPSGLISLAESALKEKKSVRRQACPLRSHPSLVVARGAAHSQGAIDVPHR